MFRLIIKSGNGKDTEILLFVCFHASQIEIASCALHSTEKGNNPAALSDSKISVPEAPIDLEETSSSDRLNA